MGYRVEAASPEDIPAMMRIESDPRFAGLVFHWPHEGHLQEMALPSSRYFVLRDERGEVAGFTLLQGIGDPDLKLHLKRIAVKEPGGGLGSMLLEGVLERIFGETDTNRIDLDVFVGNDRARRTYEKAGFELEGVMRDFHRRADGDFDSMWLMSVLRRDWLSRRTDSRH
jgi:RimJ/RimL family protein N-acetyltransferase